MKINNFISEILFSTLLIGVLITCLNPLNLLMPLPFITLIVIALLLIFGLFSVYIWNERKGDERQNYHKILSGHFAFLTGSIILVMGIVYQELNSKLDPWLVYALIGMIIAKLLSQYYSEKKN
jgi:hypothetical protein